jgi:hypothetical protein
MKKELHPIIKSQESIHSDLDTVPRVVLEIISMSLLCCCKRLLLIHILLLLLLLICMSYADSVPFSSSSPLPPIKATCLFSRFGLFWLMDCMPT